MIKVTVKAEVYYEKQTENNLVYRTELEVGCKADFKRLRKTVLKVTELDAMLMEDIQGSYIAVIGGRNYTYCLNSNDKVILELNS